MNLIFFDDNARAGLLPFVFTRPTAALPVGTLTVAQKWQRYLSGEVSYRTTDALAPLFSEHVATDNYLINGRLLPDPTLTEAVAHLEEGEALVCKEELLALRANRSRLADLPRVPTATGFRTREHPDATLLRHGPDLFALCGAQLRHDFELLTRGRISAPVTDAPTVVYAPDNVFLEEDVTLRAAVLNAEHGPIYLGRGVSVQEGSVLRGPLSVGDFSQVNAGARLRGDSAIGPHCKVGGEVSNSILFGYSNKGHDGFIGNTVLGEWCNLGADTNTSNLKNNYGPVRLYHYGQRRMVDTGRQFCGLMMGDHAKASINTMFNTGTTVGVGANVFGGGFPPKFVPDFSWGGAQGFETYNFERFLTAEGRMMARRDRSVTPAYAALLRTVYQETSPYR